MHFLETAPFVEQAWRGNSLGGFLNVRDHVDLIDFNDIKTDINQVNLVNLISQVHYGQQTPPSTEKQDLLHANPDRDGRSKWQSSITALRKFHPVAEASENMPRMSIWLLTLFCHARKSVCEQRTLPFASVNYNESMRFGGATVAGRW